TPPRLETRYLDEAADDLDDALARAEAARADRHAVSIGLLGNAAEVLPRLVELDAPADIVTGAPPPPLSLGRLATPAEALPRLVELDAPADIVTDQTPAHDPLSYIPAGLSLS